MSKDIAKRKVIYDLTRMFVYLERVFPGGIERVDINYLHGLLNDERFLVQGLIEVQVNKKSRLIGIDTDLVRRIHHHLYERWILGRPDDSTFAIQGKHIKEEIIRLLPKKHMTQDGLIDQSLLNLCDDAFRPLYVNCTFINIPDGDQHHELMSRCAFDPVYVVHDLIAIEFPEFGFTNDKGLGHLSRLFAADKLGATIVAISEHVRGKITEISRSLGLDNLDIRVNHNGVDDRFLQKRPSSSIQRKNQFVFVSTIEPRKNHLLLLNVWRKIINSGIPSSQIPKLHIIGRRGWSFQAVADVLDRSPAIAQHVIEHNKAPDEVLVEIIQSSRAMLFPSFDEGWGLPIVESLALGTPVICSDIPVHRECTQGNAVYIDPIDGLGWYRTILDVAMGEQILDCSGFKPVTWKQATKRFNELLNSIHKLGIAEQEI